MSIWELIGVVVAVVFGCVGISMSEAKGYNKVFGFLAGIILGTLLSSLVLATTLSYTVPKLREMDKRG